MTANRGFDAPVMGSTGNLLVEEGTAQPLQISPGQCDDLSHSNNGPVVATPSRSSSADGPSSASPAPEGLKSPAPYQLLEPPITTSSLSMLEISQFAKNAKLRHDINFDPELHFRPNVEGEHGRRKETRASIFWAALKEQLMEFIANRPSFYEKHGMGDDWCLPKLLKTVKDILQTIVPKRDRQFLDDGLNVELLMQQLHHGIADLEKLAVWLSRLLKSHCAPMRDEWVDSMYTQLSSGNRNNDIDELVNGMCSLLSVLEAMKLDVANHQIRCLRPAMIEETTAFEQRFLMKKLRNRKMDISDAKPWYRDAARTYSGRGATSSSSFGDTGIFFEGLSRSMLPSAGDKPLPGTFFFDEDRMGRVRSDILDAINLDVCMRMYEDLERIARFNTTPIFSNHASEDEPLMPSMIDNEFNFNTQPSHSRPASLALSPAGSDSSSPRSSLVLPSYFVPYMNESKAKARNPRDSLVALLQQAPHDLRLLDRWRAMAPSMALQIFRFTNTPLEMLSTFEEKLTENVCKITSPIFEEIEEGYRARLVAELATRVRYFKSLSGVGLFSIATGNDVPSNNRGLGAGRDRDLDAVIRVGQQEGGIEDIATRIAHVGVVHWRIWSRMAYVDEDDMSMD
ncbi:T-complex protein 11-domain-containing protein [Dactylonectria macrodidyma]|uniref:T-complex protein 11-domain-containing protein n=1 Tax=Dactylonectria macrodidyma TaxID=307937 RepID=A0A9P9D4A3_9HYPO|nr:T-complex protein 11-domain-containing protein [Dactylonectria macrodidyma]